MTSKMRYTIPVFILILLFYLLVSPISSAFAEESASVRIDASAFPDAAFRQWVLTNADTNGDRTLDSSEILAVTSINISQNKDIQSVSGIEYFTALEQLNCNYTNLRELDLTANTRLNNLSALSTYLAALNMPKGFSGLSSVAANDNVIWLNDGESSFDLKNLAPSLRSECVQGISLPSVTLNGTVLKGLVPGEDFYYYYVYDGTSNFNYTSNKIVCNFDVRSTSTKPVSARPDSGSVVTDTPISIYSAEVSLQSLYALAKESYYNCAGEFVIDATSSVPVDSVYVTFQVGALPTGDYGKLNDLGIETNFGHLRVKAEALRILFDSTRYSSVSFNIQKSGDNEFRLSRNTSPASSSSVSTAVLPEGSIQFTVFPEGTLVGKELQYRFSGSAATSTYDCISNSDGSVTMQAEKTGIYTLLEKKASDIGTEIDCTLDIINPSYGYADWESANSLTIGANSGCYIQDIIVNGVSVGPKELLTVAEGDVIRIVFAKTGETVDINTGESLLSKTNRIAAGVQATTIKAKTTSGKKGIIVSWIKSKGYAVDYFEIFRSTKKTTGYGTKAFFTTKTGTAKSYTNTKSLKKGTRYYYKIRGVRILDGKKYYTNWSNVCYRKAL